MGYFWHDSAGKQNIMGGTGDSWDLPLVFIGKHAFVWRLAPRSLLLSHSAFAMVL